MITVSKPNAELADRVIDGIIVVPEGTDTTGDLSAVVGRIMFESSDVSLGSGFNNGLRRKVYFEAGYVPNLQATIKALNLTGGKQLPQYKLVVREALTPYFEGQQPKMYPSGHPREGESCTHQGAEIFRQTFMVAASSPEVDQLLPLDRDEVAAPRQEMTANVSDFQA